MHDMRERTILAFLKKKLPRSRFMHSRGVMRTAEMLALRYGEDPAKARLAGLLHDCSRGYSFATVKKLARRYDPKIFRDPVLKDNPFLLHGFASAYIAKKHFRVKDQRVLDAIMYHTIARPHMTKLDAVIYCADMIAPDRRFDEVQRLRRIARRSLSDALRYALRIKILFVLKKNMMVHPHAVMAFNELVVKKMYA